MKILTYKSYYLLKGAGKINLHLPLPLIRFFVVHCPYLYLYLCILYYILLNTKVTATMAAIVAVTLVLRSI